MSEKIFLVQDDNRPYVTLTLTSTADGTPIDLTGATVTVQLRAAGTTGILSTITAEIVTASEGIARYKFPGNTLNVPAGNYEGEVNIVFPGGDKLTVYEIQKYQVRSKF